jgi:hypothetical protein
MRATRTRRGQTMIEALVSTGILTLLAGGAFAVLRDSGAIFGASVRRTTDQREVDQALDRLVRELEQASASTAVVDTSAPDTDLLRCQLPIDLLSSPIVLGAVLCGGTKVEHHPGASIEWTSRERKPGGGERELIRRVVAADGATLLQEEVVCGDLDRVDPKGRKSFVVTLADRQATVTLRRRSDQAPLPLVVRSLRVRSQ